MKVEEYDDIRAELLPPSFRDPALIPECFALALRALGEIACPPAECICGPTYATYEGPQAECPEHGSPQYLAEQALRRMVQRAKTGIPIYEAEDIRG